MDTFTEEPSTFDDPKETSMSANMRAQGVEPYEKSPADYFAFDETHVVTLPDGVSTVTHKTLNEGQRRKYLNKVNRDVKFHRGTGDAVMRLAPGEEKQALLESALCDWSLVRGGQPIPFTPANLKEFLTKAPPTVIDVIDKAVRKVNSWLMTDATVEDIDEEIANLTETRQKLVEEQEGKGV